MLMIMVSQPKVPERTVPRSLLYIRILGDLLNTGHEFVSSRELADLTGLQDSQIRKDISNFGAVGKPRVGYPVRALKELLEDRVYSKADPVVLFGVGHLGKAIARYPEFQSDRIHIAAAFDTDARKVGGTVGGIRVYSLAEAKRVVRRLGAEIGINAVPKAAAQEVVDLMVEMGIRGIINFSPVHVAVPAGITVRNIDLTIEFMTLLCDM